ncbi:DUF6625 family protein [Pseudomonas subflava]|uniref:DUF6625 family protein n=1 Tax=Pseudomonas subflava TaxID=2952933 RepID=UPI00207AB3EB|nr:DUF6625 family protein [Pseudomonas subflava]
MKEQHAQEGGAPSIRFLIPYFGRWPFWFEFFLESCRRNPSIDWLLFTDCPIPDDAPGNVQFTRIGFDEYCELVSARLGIDFRPRDPYKLCDIKPALGAVHADALAGYDFWAFGDIDVVYGDLRRYFTADRLSRKDLFATHQRRISGHLCLLRNTPRMINAFRRIPRWQQRYEDQAHQALDEGAFSRIFIRHKNWPEPLQRFAARFNTWNRQSEFMEAHSTYTLHEDGRRVVPETWFFREGRLTNSEQGGTELPYLHFMVWKNSAWKGVSPDVLLGPPGLPKADAWQIGPQGWRALPVEERVQ